jgi:hypothetical protein
MLRNVVGNYERESMTTPLEPEQTALFRLKTALIAWRRAERAYCTAVLDIHTPRFMQQAREAESQALRELRTIVDSEPWADIEAGL